MLKEPAEPLAVAIRKLAIQANTRSWELLGQPTRSEEENFEMVAAGNASWYLWNQVGTDLHRARAHWLLSRVHVVVGDSLRGLKHAEYCASYTTHAGDAAKDFDHAYAQECLARAHAAQGREVEARAFRNEAARLGQKILDPEDQSVFGGDFVVEPWFGVNG